MNNLSLVVNQEHEFRETFNLIRPFITSIGFDSYQTANFILAVSEILTNALRYAGHANIVVTRTTNNRGIEIIISDTGPGIDDIEKAMQDGFSTFPEVSLGLGLGAAKRCVDDLEIISSRKGTKVTLRHYLKGYFSNLDIGVASFPIEGEFINGDSYVIKEYEGNKLIVSVIDGVGHGNNAHKSSSIVAELIRQNPTDSLKILLKKIHDRLSGNKELNSVEIALAKITEENIEIVLVGDARGSFISSNNISIRPNDGRLGEIIPEDLCITKIPRPEVFSLILFSDGISKDFSLDLSTISMISAQKIAESIFNSYATPHDDATICVLTS